MGRGELDGFRKVILKDLGYKDNATLTTYK